MEVLNYSLWFTLVWWTLTVLSTTSIFGETIKWENIVKHFIALPSIAILLEYLIMR